eukprot:gb/GECG01004216.1/.p1 GENE.gb/GECG01004216.1/~~gb/GECG01004216.1/.p1  ORF type:complete len:145 (+),score=7.91 gb/GECG01004216.1/:1-435(+)
MIGREGSTSANRCNAGDGENVTDFNQAFSSGLEIFTLCRRMRCSLSELQSLQKIWEHSLHTGPYLPATKSSMALSWRPKQQIGSYQGKHRHFDVVLQAFVHSASQNKPKTSNGSRQKIMRHCPTTFTSTRPAISPVFSLVFRIL